jgi:hypothetical protein
MHGQQNIKKDTVLCVGRQIYPTQYISNIYVTQ